MEKQPCWFAPAAVKNGGLTRTRPAPPRPAPPRPNAAGARSTASTASTPTGPPSPSPPWTRSTRPRPRTSSSWCDGNRQNRYSTSTSTSTSACDTTKTNPNPAHPTQPTSNPNLTRSKPITNPNPQVSGTGQTKFGLNWGNGFITNPATIQQYGLSDPNPFFQELLRRPYLGRVILGPHCYPPSITGATFLGQALHEKLSASFGYLQTKGYCYGGRVQAAAADADAVSDASDAAAAAGGAASAFESSSSGNSSSSSSSSVSGAVGLAAAAVNGSSDALLVQEAGAAAPQSRRLLEACARFPVVIGEFGSLFESASDVQWMGDFAAWLNGQAAAVGAPLGWAYWAVNANSGDTGGLVGANWQTFMWVKLRFLQERMGLRPWYA